MAITYQPDKLLRKLAPEKLVEKLVTQDLTLNRAVLTLLEKSGVLSKKKLETIALKVLKQYKSKYKSERSAGASVDGALEEAVADNALMIQRVQNAIVNEITNDIKTEYAGEFYTWLPSSAETPDPLHQLNYGETFQVGVGEMPGDRYGCQCGMEIQVPETKLNL